MATDRPMSEYENALSEVARVLTLTVLAMGADPEILQGNLEESRQNFEDMGSKNAAAVIARLIRTVFEPAYLGPTRSVRDEENSN